MTTYVYAHSILNNCPVLIWKSNLIDRRSIINEMIAEGITDSEANVDDFVFFEKPDNKPRKYVDKWDLTAFFFGSMLVLVWQYLA